MKSFSIEWFLSSGHRIHAQAWESERDKVKGVVGVLHGMGGHVGLYADIVRILISDGFHVVGFDQVGHGKSDGKRGDSPSYDLLLENVGKLVEEMRTRYGSLPLFLFAHSMGANVMLNYLLTRQPTKLKGAIASAPWIRLVNRPSAAKIKLARFLAKFHPSLLKTTGLNRQAISRDKAYLSKYLIDHLSHSKISLRFFFSIRSAGKMILKKADDLSVPLLLYHGTGDKITSYKASKQFAKRVKNKELLTIQLLPEVYHEPHNDVGKELVYEIILQWLNKQLN